MNTNATIRQLVDDLKPVAPRKSDAASIARWSVVVVAVLMFEMIVAFVRGTAFPDVSLATWLWQAILPLGIALAAAVAALRCSIPGRPHRSWLAVASLLCLLWAGVLATAVARSGPSTFAVWMAEPAAKCAAHIAAAALPGALALFWFVRAGAPLSGVRTGILIGLAAGASGALATHLTCPNPSAAHVLLWHAGTVIAIAIAGSATSRWLTAWSRLAQSG
jgi:hypothetical protein